MLGVGAPLREYPPRRSRSRAPVDSVDGVDESRRLPARRAEKEHKEEPTGEAAAPASVGSAGGNGLRLPFLCEQVIGRRAPRVDTHPSEPIE
jgi:hypothetical protein